MPSTDTPTPPAPSPKASACFAAFDELGVDAPAADIMAAVAAAGSSVSENYVYDLKKQYREGRRSAVAAVPPPKGAKRDSGAASRPAAGPAPADSTDVLVEAVQAARTLLRLLGPAGAKRLLDALDE